MDAHDQPRRHGRRDLVPTSAERIALGLDQVLSMVVAGGSRVVLYMTLADGDYCVANGLVFPGTKNVEKILGSVRFAPSMAGEIAQAAATAAEKVRSK